MRSTATSSLIRASSRGSFIKASDGRGPPAWQRRGNCICETKPAALAAWQSKKTPQRCEMKLLNRVLLSVATNALLMAIGPFSLSLADDDASPIFGVKLPSGYRHWELVAPSHEGGNFNEL